MHVDEARADDEAGGVDDTFRPLAGEAADRDDAPAIDADVRREPRIAGAVDDLTAANQQVEQALLLLVELSDELAGHPLVAGEQAAVDGDHRPGDP
jgi:hypothetical protein